MEERVRFILKDYREVEGPFDRIVSVGMFEHVGVPNPGEKGSLSALAGCSETGTAARIPLGERLKKCFGILFGCTRMPRLDGAIAAKNHRYIRKAGPGRGDRSLSWRVGALPIYGATRIEMEGGSIARL